MADTTSKTQTHQLRGNGAAHNDSGAPLNPGTKTTSGEGRALCSCGWLSPSSLTGAERRGFHRIHQDVEANGMATFEQPTVGDVNDYRSPDSLLALAARAKDKADKARVRREAKEVPLTADVDDALTAALDVLDAFVADQAPATEGEAVVPWPAGVAKLFFGPAARRGTQTIYEGSSVHVEADEKALEVVLTGDPDAVAKAAHWLPRLWADANVALALWRRTSDAYRSIGTTTKEGRAASWQLEQDFLRGWYQAIADARTRNRTAVEPRQRDGQAAGRAWTESLYLATDVDLSQAL